MDDRETQLLRALVLMVQQYLEQAEDGTVDTLSMSAGEQAISALSEYGLMEVQNSRIGKWTQAGKDFR